MYYIFSTDIDNHIYLPYYRMNWGSMHLKRRKDNMNTQIRQKEELRSINESIRNFEKFLRPGRLSSNHPLRKTFTKDLKELIELKERLEAKLASIGSIRKENGYVTKKE
jgi:hypothetical protein